MSIAEPPPETRLITAEEFWALPDDGTDRDLIDGRIRVWGQKMTWRNRTHSRIEVLVSYHLEDWLKSRSQQGDMVVSGEAGFRLRPDDPQSLVGIDVAYASAELVASTDPKFPYFDGPPVLAVEILSPSDSHEKVVAKIHSYLEAGSVVWVIDPDFQTVSVHRPGQTVEVLNVLQELSGEPYLPGFRLAVAQLFS
jgi:Uma2 family endonuclease